MNLAAVCRERSIVVVCGSGGVGKTTTSAAIALGAARRGAKVCALTIDPARRLADALGVEGQLGAEAHEVELGPGSAGRLFAMMLDAKRTFDHLVEEHAPTPEARDRILGNRVYQQLSSALAGSQEYMAMEKLYELHHEGRFDLLVLDTPPSRNALDFIDAPNRMTRFIEGKALRFLMEGGARAGGLGLRALGRGSLLAWQAAEKVLGVSFLRDVTEFLLAFEGMYEGFKERAGRVRDLLADERTVFLLVTTPERAPVDEAVFFWRRLVEADLPFGGVIVNKVHPDLLEGTSHGDAAALRAAAEAELLAAGVAAAASVRAAGALDDEQALADRDRAGIERLARRLGAEPVLEVPILAGDVHDVPGLDRLDEHLFVSPD